MSKQLIKSSNVTSLGRMILNSIVTMDQILNSNFCFGVMMIMNNVNTHVLLNFENVLMYVINGVLVYDM